MPDLERDLPNFKQLLPKYSHELTYGTLWRYKRGMLPAFGEFLVAHPELIFALGIDATLLLSQRTGQSLAAGVDLDTKRAALKGEL